MRAATRASLVACTLLTLALATQADPAKRDPAEPRLTFRAVLQLCASMDAAAKAKDADALVANFAPGAVLTLVTPPAHGAQTVEMSVAEYRAGIVAGWSAAEDVRYAVKDREVRMGPDGRSAEVSDTKVGTLTIQGQEMSTSTQETFTVQIVDGAPRVTRLVGRVLF